MKTHWIALLTASVRVSASASPFLLESEEQPHAGYIIELEPGTVPEKRDTHSLFHRSAEGSANYSVRHEFTNSDYFYGLSVDASEEDAAVLASLPSVKHIWPNRVHARPTPFGVAPLEKRSVESAWLSSRGEEGDDGNVTVAYVKGDSDVNSALKMAGVDKVHELGITGKGVRIAVIDSGIDYRHPALGGGFGKGFKVAGGYDLVGEDYTGYNMPVPDDDPLVTCLDGGHGTHVSGTSILAMPLEQHSCLWI